MPRTSKLSSKSSPSAKAPPKAAFPPRYLRFWSSGEAKKYDKMYLQDLPHYLPNARFPVKFLEPESQQFQDRLALLGKKGVIPLAALKNEDQFLCAHLKEEGLPVSMWEHENGEFYRVAPNLSSFLAMLHKKGEETSLDRYLSESVKASRLREKGKAKEALSIFAKLAPLVPTRQDRADYAASYFHERAHCYEDLNQPKRAVDDFRKALELGDTKAGLCGGKFALLQLKDAKSAETFFEKADIYDGEEGELLTYKGLSLLARGATAQALKQFSILADIYTVTKPRVLRQAATVLAQHCTALKIDPKAMAKSAAMLTPKVFVLSATELKAARKWWADLPKAGKGIQAKLLECIDASASKRPGESELARIFELEELYLDECGPIKSVEPFAAFKKLHTLCVVGNVMSLRALEGLKNLRELSVNYEDIDLPKGLKVKGPFGEPDLGL